MWYPQRWDQKPQHQACKLCEQRTHCCMLLPREAFRLIPQLQSLYPDRPEAVDYDRALARLVDVVAESSSEVDNAYYLLEEMHAQVRQCCSSPQSSATCCGAHSILCRLGKQRQVLREDRATMTWPWKDRLGVKRRVPHKSSLVIGA